MHLHVAIAAVVDPTTMRDPYSYDRLRAFLAGRLAGQPLFRRRVVEVPLGLGHPVWVEDAGFDLDHHIRRHVVPSPGGTRELSELIGAIVSVPLDRSRPLWEIHVIEGLDDGNVALLGKVHHAAVDGVSGTELFAHVCDLTPDPAAPPSPGDAAPARPERIPSGAELVGDALVSQARRTLSLPGLVGRTVRATTHLVSRHRDPAAAVGAVPLRAPRTPWTAAITAERSVAFARLRMADVRRIRAAFGVKVNDVVLAVASGAARRYLAERDALPAQPLVGMCPISVRTDDERGRSDNRVSAMFVHLRTDVADAAERLLATARGTRGAKEDHNLVGGRFVQNWAEHAAPGTFTVASRLYSRLHLADRHPPVYNVVVSNVPGPDVPLYLGGARLVAAYPMGPVMEGAGLNITVLSYLDHVDVGFLAAAELVPDLDDLAGHVDDAMAELLAAADLVDPPVRSLERPAHEPLAATLSADAGELTPGTGVHRPLPIITPTDADTLVPAPTVARAGRRRQRELAVVGAPASASSPLGRADSDAASRSD
jgi:diacylglycerol O-acyltransferase / wax synthase